MHTAYFVSSPADLVLLTPGCLWVKLPATSYRVPASLNPILMCVLRGALYLNHDSWQAAKPLPFLSICGATRTVRQVYAEADTELLLLPLQADQVPAYLQHPASDFFESFHDVETLLDKPTKLLQEQVLTNAQQPPNYHIALLMQFLRQQRRLNTPKNLLLPNMAWHEQPIQALAKQHGLSTRQLQRRFLQVHGYSLRMFQQQIRCSRLLVHLLSQTERSVPAWAHIAVQYGYADQSHFIRDIRRFTDHSPTTLWQGIRQNLPEFWLYHLALARLPKSVLHTGF